MEEMMAAMAEMMMGPPPSRERGQGKFTDKGFKTVGCSSTSPSPPPPLLALVFLLLPGRHVLLVNLPLCSVSLSLQH